MKLGRKPMTVLGGVLLAASVMCLAAGAPLAAKEGGMARDADTVRVLSSTEDIVDLSIDQWILLRLIEAEHREITEHLVVHIHVVQDALVGQMLASGELHSGQLTKLFFRLVGELAAVQLNTELKIRQILTPGQAARLAF